MSRYCKGCNLKKDLKVKSPPAYAEWKNAHICRYNYKSSAGGMKAEGAKRVFERSIKKHKLKYVEFLGDGDTKSYVNIKDTYPGIEIKKLECVGHYQKRLKTRLRNLKKRKRNWVVEGTLLMLPLTYYRNMQVFPSGNMLETLKV